MSENSIHSNQSEEVNELFELFKPVRINKHLRRLLFAYLYRNNDVDADKEDLLFDINLLFELLELLNEKGRVTV